MLAWFEGIIKNTRVIWNAECDKVIELSRNDDLFKGTDLEEYYTSNAQIINTNGVSLVNYLKGMRFMAYYISSKGDVFNSFVSAFPYHSTVSPYLIDGVDRGINYQARLYMNSLVIRLLLKCHQFPLYQLYSGYREQAIEILRDEMMTAKSSRDRTTAADRLLFHLKEPENVQVDVKVDNTENIVTQCEAMLENLVSKQLEMISSNKATDIINVEIVNE